MRTNKKTYFLLFISAILMVLLCSFTTSPIYPFYKGWDSGLFQVIGKGWVHGHVPYKELYDQKGPVIFFIDMLGYLLTGNRIGVFIIQIVFMFVSEILIYRILSRAFSNKIAAIMTAIGMFIFSCNYECGNLCEEYANPLLIGSLYLVSEWISNIRNNKEEHNPLYALLYGFTFGFCMMSRLTNAVGVCVAVFMIVVYLCLKKQWSNLLRNAAMFIAGAAIIIVPFMIYFAVKDSTYDFWYGTILYNISYASNSSNSIMTVIKGAMGQIGSYAIIAVGILYIANKEYYKGSVYAAIGIVTQMMLMRIMNYGHYSMITFPYLPIAIYELKNLYDCRKQANDHGLLAKISIFIMAAVIVIGLARTGKEMKKVLSYYKFYSKEAKAEYTQLLNFVGQIPEEDRDSVVGYGTNPWFYLDMDITPACRFFVMQDWQAEFSDSFTSLLIKEFSEKKPKWIVVCKEEKELGIQDILSKNYTEYAKEVVVDSQQKNEFILYKVNN